jgi:hypothetical protein
MSYYLDIPEVGAFVIPVATNRSGVSLVINKPIIRQTDILTVQVVARLFETSKPKLRIKYKDLVVKELEID